MAYIAKQSIQTLNECCLYYFHFTGIGFKWSILLGVEAIPNGKIYCILSLFSIWYGCGVCYPSLYYYYSMERSHIIVSMFHSCISIILVCCCVWIKNNINFGRFCATQNNQINKHITDRCYCIDGVSFPTYQKLTFFFIPRMNQIDKLSVSHNVVESRTYCRIRK